MIRASRDSVVVVVGTLEEALVMDEVVGTRTRTDVTEAIVAATDVVIVVAAGNQQESSEGAGLWRCSMDFGYCQRPCASWLGSSSQGYRRLAHFLLCIGRDRGSRTSG